MPGVNFSPSYKSAWKDESVEAVLEVAEKFVANEIDAHREKWETQRHVDHEVWEKAGKLGLLLCSIPEEFGGGGGTIAHDLAVFEAQARTGDTSWGVGVHSGIVAHYILEYGTTEQKQKWLPRLASGEIVGAIGMTEPGTGSDLKAIRTRAERRGDEYVVNGSKIFITNGNQADLICLVCTTDPEAGGKGLSILLVETATTPGFERGRILDKVGQHGADTSELFFVDAKVPAENLLGEKEGLAMRQMMAQLSQERLAMGVTAVTLMERAIDLTVKYVKEREAFGHPLWEFQNTRFVLAELATRAHVARLFIDSCVERHMAGGLDIHTAAMMKWWVSQEYCDTVDECVQLFGGYGYMREYPIARMYEDARIFKIYAGSNETMKDLVSRSL